MTDETKDPTPESATAEAPEAGSPAAPDEPAGDDSTPAAATSGAEGSSDPAAAELEAARREAATNWETVLRTRAELENVRKRGEREVENAHRYGLERFVSELLPVRDSLEMGLAAAGADDVDPARIREGLDLTLKMLDQAVGKFGVVSIDPAGERFDPERHQAMTMQEAEGVEPGTVVTVVQKGYVLNERLVRPAMVIVAK